MFKYSDLNGKDIVVTGANGDIGISVCKKFIEQGAIVHAVYNKNKEKISELKNECNDKINVYRCNINNNDSILKFIVNLKEKTNKIYTLVNNAGIVKDELFSEMNIINFENVINTNLIGTCRFTQSMLLFLRAAGNASIVNVSSIAGIVPSIGQSNYSASKSGVIGFSHTLAAELAGKGIRVNNVAPGMIESDMVKKVSRQVVRHLKSIIPIQRLGLSTEVANTILFLSSEASGYIVGQTIIVDGGMVMR
ncbi:SDR family oxidoreductase [Morganella morganii]|nr:SDR family oxidoreductase [Morganella morganii]